MDSAQVVVSVSILCVCVLIGIPLWWNTTKVYRAQLPHEKILSLRNAPIEIETKINIRLSSDVTFSAKALEELFVEDVLRHNKHSNIIMKVQVRLVTVDRDKTFEEYCQILEKSQQLSYAILMLTKAMPTIEMNACPVGLNAVVFLPEDTGVKAAYDKVVRFVSAYTFLGDQSHNFKLPQPARNLGGKQVLPPSPSYHLTYTLAVANPMDYLLTWNIESAVENYLQPFLEKLKFMGPFHVSSQVLYYADVNVKPNKDGDIYYIPKSKLPLFINPLELRLNTYTTTDVGLNFIVYVPTKSYSPLVIKNKKSDTSHFTAFKSPRWGGLQFYSPSNTTSNKVTVPMDKLIQVFIEQFKDLIGFSVTKENVVLGVGSNDAFDWLRLKLMISKTLEQLQKCISTLSSLSKLLDEIANIVIRDDIKDMVESAVKEAEQSKKYLMEGNFEEAFVHSKNAWLASEKAFYDSSLLSLLYFPDDQKYAIYVPLFLPIALPIFISFGKAVKLLRRENTKVKME